MRFEQGLVAVTAFAGLLIVACDGSQPSDTTPLETQGETMQITSLAFEEQGSIPAIYTCDGDNISPPLRIEAIPPEAGSLVLIVDDPDAPRGTWDHWVAFDIPPTAEIPEDVGSLGVAGRNSSGDVGYDAPCPPSGTHRYVFQVYALDTELGLSEGASKSEVLEAMEGHVLAQGTLIGRYGR